MMPPYRVCQRGFASATGSVQQQTPGGSHRHRKGTGTNPGGHTRHDNTQLPVNTAQVVQHVLDWRCKLSTATHHDDDYTQLQPQQRRCNAKGTRTEIVVAWYDGVVTANAAVNAS